MGNQGFDSMNYRKSVSDDLGHQIRGVWPRSGVQEFNSSGRPGAAPLTPVVAQSPKARQAGDLGVLGLSG
jgi:hypothetical protein